MGNLSGTMGNLCQTLASIVPPHVHVASLAFAFYDCTHCYYAQQISATEMFRQGENLKSFAFLLFSRCDFGTWRRRLYQVLNGTPFLHLQTWSEPDKNSSTLLRPEKKKQSNHLPCQSSSPWPNGSKYLWILENLLWAFPCSTGNCLGLLGATSGPPHIAAAHTGLGGWSSHWITLSTRRSHMVAFLL